MRLWTATDERDRVEVAREFPDGGESGRRPEVDRDRSVIVVLSTRGDSRRSTGCGETLSAVLSKPPWPTSPPAH